LAVNVDMMMILKNQKPATKTREGAPRGGVPVPEIQIYM
jgi:hypothetical protein